MNCGGKWYLGQQGWYHDFWFTDELRYLFTFGGDFSLQFQSADDMFVYINGILVADLGGVHQSLPAKVTVAGATGWRPSSKADRWTRRATSCRARRPRRIRTAARRST